MLYVQFPLDWLTDLLLETRNRRRRFQPKKIEAYVSKPKNNTFDARKHVLRATPLSWKERLRHPEFV